MNIDDLLKYTIAASILLVTYLSVISLIDLQIQSYVANTGYLNYISSLYLDRLKYCAYLSYRSYDYKYMYRFYIPSIFDENLREWYNNSLWKCYNIIGGTLTQVADQTADQTNDKEIKYYEIKYSAAPYIELYHIPNNTNNQNSFLTVNVLSSLYREYTNREINITREEVLNLFTNIITGKFLYVGVKAFINEIKNFINSEDGELFIKYTEYSLPTLAVDMEGRLYVIYPNMYGYFKKECKKLIIENDNYNIENC